MLEIHWPPRSIQVVERRQPLLDGHAVPKLGGRADDDPREPIVGGLEEMEPCLTRLRLVDKQISCAGMPRVVSLCFKSAYASVSNATSSGVSVSTITAASSSRVETVSMAFGVPRSRNTSWIPRSCSVS